MIMIISKYNKSVKVNLPRVTLGWVDIGFKLEIKLGYTPLTLKKMTPKI